MGMGMGHADTEQTLADELHVVEMLERERRQWHSERVKLVHCIHLQQLELASRSVAAQERANDIAREFARAIGRVGRPPAVTLFLFLSLSLSLSL